MLTFSSAMPSQIFTVCIVDDSMMENDEFFYVVVESNDPNCRAGDPIQVTITDDGKRLLPV